MAPETGRHVDAQQMLAMTGFVEPGHQHNRRMLYDQLYGLLPRDPNVRVQIYTSEILPGGYTDWHVHNGPAFFLVLQGQLTVEFQEGVRHYTAGDTYVEPIGVIHRAHNPDPTTSFICVGFVLTPPDREPVVNIKQPW
jgi:quercetin dioxygenase-like cupin family protein